LSQVKGEAIKGGIARMNSPAQTSEILRNIIAISGLKLPWE